MTRVVQCHGSFATATCMKCKYKVQADAIKEDIFDQVKLSYIDGLQDLNLLSIASSTQMAAHLVYQLPLNMIASGRSTLVDLN